MGDVILMCAEFAVYTNTYFEELLKQRTEYHSSGDIEKADLICDTTDSLHSLLEGWPGLFVFDPADASSLCSGGGHGIIVYAVDGAPGRSAPVLPPTNIQQEKMVIKCHRARVIDTKFLDQLVRHEAFNDYLDPVEKAAPGSLPFDPYSGRLRYPDEDEGQYIERTKTAFAAWLKNNALSVSEAQWLAARWSMCSDKTERTMKLLLKSRVSTEQGAVNYPVEGVFAAGCVALLGGERIIGKSTGLLELVVSYASGEEMWFGFPIKRQSKDGFAVMIAGEDPRSVIDERIDALCGYQPGRAIIEPQDDRPIEKILADLDELPIDILVVDPAAKYLVGGEREADNWNTLFSHLERFAKDKDCAVVVAHHLKRDARIRSLNDIPPAIRGSGVVLDRPRIITGMFLKKGETVFGIPEINGQPAHNLNQDRMFKGPRQLKRDPKTMRHIPIFGDKMGSVNIDPTCVLDVRTAIERQMKTGQRLTLTGNTGVYESELPGLEKYSRSDIRAATSLLTERGDIAKDASGALVTSKMEVLG